MNDDQRMDRIAVLMTERDRLRDQVEMLQYEVARKTDLQRKLDLAESTLGRMIDALRVLKGLV